MLSANDPVGNSAQQIYNLVALPWTTITGNADGCPPETPSEASHRDLSISISAVNQGCAEDITGDGVVNAADLAQLLGKWGRCPCPGCCPSDFNDDGVINAADLATLLGSWGPCS